jgi:dTDP-glucose pyrophosphorylase
MPKLFTDSRDSTTTLILPAAGWGQRVHALTQGASKELLPDPQSGEPLIQKFLNFANEQNWSCLVLTRKEKTDLRSFLEGRAQVEIVPDTKDWPETVLFAEPFFTQKNFLCLPDTQFALDQLLKAEALLQTARLIYGSHWVRDPENWGIVTETKVSEKCSFPSEALARSRAWGFMAFRQEVGKSLLLAHQKSNLERKPIPLPEKAQWIDLEEFSDLTRDTSAIKVER